ncbi:DUF1080 domain-containing protein [Daejeonella sp. H1SJ63]|uniref:3-keto-disaccharide hydrolase n=1 Tax=Daejeonella sp. H1SJ63 TaxID=3034145 RepID=UPI0023ED8864|nr:DUF1080 domain-containing protein [Daejeonella sp. H1SJ63]
MKRISLIILAAVLFSGFDSPETSKNVSDSSKKGWQKLFDGKSTAGWHTYGKQQAGAAWKVNDGALYLDAKNKTKESGGDLTTNEEFSNFHLKLEWKISKNGNSGIIFFVNEDLSKYPASYNTGPEMQVLDNDGHADGKINKHRAGDLYDLIASSSEPVKPVGQWNKVEIIASKGKLDFIMNGVKVVSTTMWDEQWKTMVAGSKFKTMPGFSIYKSGKIALQDHGDEVWYRNIEIKRL